MNNSIHIIITMLMSMTAATYLFCAMVLWLGGWLNNERKYHSTKLQKYLSFSDLVSGILIIVLVLVEVIPEESQLTWLNCADYLCFIPFAMMYPESILLCQQRPSWKSWVHAFGLMAVGLPVMLIWGPTNPLVTMCTFGIILLYLLLLYANILYRLRRWDRQMCEEYSDISHKQTAWFRHLTMPFILLMLLWIPMYLYPEQEWIYILYYLLSASLAVALSSHALAHEEFDFTIVKESAPIAAAEPDQNEATDSPAWAKKLEKQMTELHLYRNPDLTLTLLAEEIGVNRTYLSNYINRNVGGSFYDYIATFRISEAKTLLAETNLSLSEITNKCGFSSQASFSRTFKNNVGVTPTEYRNSHS